MYMLIENECNTLTVNGQERIESSIPSLRTILHRNIAGGMVTETSWTAAAFIAAHEFTAPSIRRLSLHHRRLCR